MARSIDDLSNEELLRLDAEWERVAWERFSEAATTFADALANPRVWIKGDGEGGAALEILTQLLHDRGICDPLRLTLQFHPRISKKLRAEIAARDGHLCRVCGSRKRLQIDHRIPCSRGGPDTAENLWVLCRKCNHEKLDRTVDEWLGADWQAS